MTTCYQRFSLFSKRKKKISKKVEMRRHDWENKCCDIIWKKQEQADFNLVSWDRKKVLKSLKRKLTKSGENILKVERVCDTVVKADKVCKNDGVGWGWGRSFSAYFVLHCTSYKCYKFVKVCKTRWKMAKHLCGLQLI